MQFTPWSMLVDFGLLSCLLLAGMVLRARVKLIQELFLPAGLIAGLLGLIFGPNGLGYIPFSSSIGTYPGILIAMVFASLPLTAPPTRFREVVDRVGSLWAITHVEMTLQYGLGCAFGIFVLSHIWPSLNSAFGLMLGAGFAGGHGTAAAMGAAFDGLGWDEAKSLAMTSATVGVVAAIVGGMILIKIGTIKKQTKFITDFNELPQSLRSGLISSKEGRPSMGTEVTSPMSLDPLASQFILVFFGYSGRLLYGKWCSSRVPQTIPASI